MCNAGLKGGKTIPWIDVCQNDGNLLAAGGGNQLITIFDKRESKIIKNFDVHDGDVS